MAGRAGKRAFICISSSSEEEDDDGTEDGDFGEEEDDDDEDGDGDDGGYDDEEEEDDDSDVKIEEGDDEALCNSVIRSLQGSFFVEKFFEFSISTSVSLSRCFFFSAADVRNV